MIFIIFILGFFTGIIFTLILIIVGAFLTKNSIFKKGLQKIESISKMKGVIYEPPNEEMEQLKNNLKE